jgi:hypothetical protein
MEIPNVGVQCSGLRRARVQQRSQCILPPTLVNSELDQQSAFHSQQDSPDVDHSNVSLQPASLQLKLQPLAAASSWTL